MFDRKKFNKLIKKIGEPGVGYDLFLLTCDLSVRTLEDFKIISFIVHSTQKYVSKKSDTNNQIKIYLINEKTKSEEVFGLESFQDDPWVDIYLKYILTYYKLCWSKFNLGKRFTFSFFKEPLLKIYNVFKPRLVYASLASGFVSFIVFVKYLLVTGFDVTITNQIFVAGIKNFEIGILLYLTGVYLMLTLIIGIIAFAILILLVIFEVNIYRYCSIYFGVIIVMLIISLLVEVCGILVIRKGIHSWSGVEWVQENGGAIGFVLVMLSLLLMLACLILIVPSSGFFENKNYIIFVIIGILSFAFLLSALTSFWSGNYTYGQYCTFYITKNGEFAKYRYSIIEESGGVQRIVILPGSSGNWIDGTSVSKNTIVTVDDKTFGPNTSCGILSEKNFEEIDKDNINKLINKGYAPAIVKYPEE